MKIEQDSVVAMHYTLKDDAGEIIDSSADTQPLEYLQGHGNIIPGLENAMLGKTVGDKFDVSIEAAEGYGEPIAELIQEAPISAFEGIPDLAVGTRLEAQTNQGPIPVRVTKITDDAVTVDGNHELAGKTLHFSIEVTEVRAASEEEVAHGHIHHGDCGH